jgi:DNA (cytosine-5)-methyltransferase 1
MIAHVVAPPLTATNDPSRSPQSSEVTAQVHAVLQAQTIAHVDVVGTLSDGAHNGGGLNGQDAYTGRILPVAVWTGDGIVADPLGTNEGRAWTNEGANNFRLHNCVQQVVPAMSVRRLTPTECERLQGFPDNWTLIPWKKKPSSECPDGPRYKALGNSMAVPCMNWLGRKINAEYWKRHDVD